MSSILHTWLNGILTATLEGGVACVTIEQMSTRRRPQVEAPRCFTALSLPRPPSPPHPVLFLKFCVYSVSFHQMSTIFMAKFLRGCGQRLKRAYLL